jgi:hypothetical protein
MHEFYTHGVIDAMVAYGLDKLAFDPQGWFAARFGNGQGGSYTSGGQTFAGAGRGIAARRVMDAQAAAQPTAPTTLQQQTPGGAASGAKAALTGSLTQRRLRQAGAL